MPLTPEDVSNKRFTPVRLREGYDMGEVDQFLDEVEAELARLTKENDDLRAEAVRRADRRRLRASRTTRPTAQTPVVQERGKPEPEPEGRLRRLPRARRGRPGRPAAAGDHPGRERSRRPPTPRARLLEIATRNADELVDHAKNDADKIIGEARTKAERLEAESKSKADRLESDARTRSQMLDSGTRRAPAADVRRARARARQAQQRGRGRCASSSASTAPGLKSYSPSSSRLSPAPASPRRSPAATTSHCAQAPALDPRRRRGLRPP